MQHFASIQIAEIFDNTLIAIVIEQKLGENSVYVEADSVYQLSI